VPNMTLNRADVTLPGNDLWKRHRVTIVSSTLHVYDPGSGQERFTGQVQAVQNTARKTWAVTLEDGSLVTLQQQGCNCGSRK